MLTVAPNTKLLIAHLKQYSCGDTFSSIMSTLNFDEADLNAAVEELEYRDLGYADSFGAYEWAVTLV